MLADGSLIIRLLLLGACVAQQASYFRAPSVRARTANCDTQALSEFVIPLGLVTAPGLLDAGLLGAGLLDGELLRHPDTTPP